MDSLRQNWFTEFSPDQQKAITGDVKTLEADDQDLWTGQAFSLEVEEVLYRNRSPYQDILVFKSKTYGNVLVLDGIIQCTERDEFAYQEMLTHVALCSHPQPKKILIIGGGDGGVVRECLKHSCVEAITVCEIDQEVVNACKRFIPGMAASFEAPGVKLHVGDGFAFMKEHKNEFDIIITDSSDPIGPAESLFKQDYYELIKSALREDGILASQAESIWIHSDLIGRMISFCQNLFAQVGYCSSAVPSYPCGGIGYLLCSKSKDTKFKEPLRVLSPEQVKNMKLRYYNSDVHRASFVLPQFAQEALGL
jgi:spermidine synthase